MLIATVLFWIFGALAQRRNSGDPRIRVSKRLAMLLGSKSDRILWDVAAIQTCIVVNLIVFAVIAILYRRLDLTASLLVSFISALVLGLYEPRVDIPCEELTGKDLAHLFALDGTAQPVAEFLEATFAAPVEAMKVPEVETNGVRKTPEAYKWWLGNTKYQLVALDSRARIARAHWPRRHQPALAKAIDCFGPPTHYFMTLTFPPKRKFLGWYKRRPQLAIDLFYVELGVMVFVRHESFRAKEEMRDNEVISSMIDSIPVTGVGWVRPGTIEEMDWQAWAPSYSENQAEWTAERTQYYRAIRPWPGAPNRMMIASVDD